MEKPKEGGMIYRSVSANEQRLLQIARENNLTVFGVRELAGLSGWGKTRVHNTLHTLKAKNHILKLIRNKYALFETVTENPFAVATEAVTPSYVSHWTALSYYGFTEQQPAVIQLVSTRQHRPFSAGPHTIEVSTLKPGRFFGYRRENNFVVADKEKTLVDSLHEPQKCGGLDEAVKCLKNAWGRVNKKTLYNHLLRFESGSLNSRMGYLIEALKLGKPPKKLLSGKSGSYVKLNSRKPKTREYNRRWNVIVNHEVR